VKAEELRDKLNEAIEKRPDCDVMIDCNNKHYNILFAKNINYNKRNSKFTPRVFLIQTKINE